MSSGAKLVVSGGGLAALLFVFVDAVLGDAGDRPPVLALGRETVAPRSTSVPQPLFEEPARLLVRKQLEEASPPPSDEKPEDEVPTYTLDEAPPVPDLPALEVEPLAFTVFEPPYDDPRIPQAVALGVQAFLREADGRIDPAEEYARWIGALSKYLAVASLDGGVELWVHVSRFPGGPHLDVGTALFYDPSTGVLGRDRVKLETRWGGSEPKHLPAKLGQADLDLDGRRELVLREHVHNGTGDSHTYLVALELDAQARPARRFSNHESMLVWWDGWLGEFKTRLIPVSSRELWAQVVYEPENGDPPLDLGHSVYYRSGPGAEYELAYQVINPAAPADTGDGFTTWGTERRPWRRREIGSR